MPSFDVVNYSLRANKSIQRSLVFEAVRVLQNTLNLEQILYVGLGSIWFTDFQIAHKLLHIKHMISIEGDDVGFKRACFNQPFKTVRVEHGYSYNVLPKLLSEKPLAKRPWLLWLDYDDGLDEDKITEIRYFIENAPINSIFLITIPVLARKFGKPNERVERIRKLLGNVVPDDLDRDSCSEDALPNTLVNLVSDFMTSVAASASRSGGFVEGFKISYRDSTPMITVGGILPAKENESAVVAATKSANWPASVSGTIETPPLTFKEASVLQGQLPVGTPITRASIQKLGFDLEEAQLQSFEKFYRYYPLFVQVSA